MTRTQHMTRTVTLGIVRSRESASAPTGSRTRLRTEIPDRGCRRRARLHRHRPRLHRRRERADDRPGPGPLGDDCSSSPRAATGRRPSTTFARRSNRAWRACETTASPSITSIARTRRSHRRLRRRDQGVRRRRQNRARRAVRGLRRADRPGPSGRPIAAVQNEFNLGGAQLGRDRPLCSRRHRVRAVLPARGLRRRGRVAQRHGATSNQVKLAWLLARSPSVAPIPGTLSLDHLQENLAALDLELTDEDLEDLG